MKTLTAILSNLFNISGRTRKPNFLKITDEEAIRNDWEAVSSDYRTAFTSFNSSKTLR